MDSSSPLTTHLLSTILPPDYVDFIHDNFLHSQAPFQTFKRQALAQAQQGLEFLYPIVQPFIDRLLILMADNQGLVGLAVAVAVITAVLVVLNWVRRFAMWCAWMSMRIVMLTVLVAVGAYVWERGVFETSRALVVGGGKFMGYLSVLKNVWLDEYNRYEEQQAMGSARAGGPAR